MNKIKFFSLTASIALAITFTSCASKPPVQEPAAQPAQQTVAAPPVQQPAAQPVQQTAPPPVQQPKAVEQSQGVLLKKVECEEVALKDTVGKIREFGNAVSENESFGTNRALADARTKLAQFLGAMVSGMFRRFDQEYASGQDGSSYIGKEAQFSEGYFEQFLTNTRTICKNTYVKEDGRYNIYVAIEMGEQGQKAILNQLKKEGKLAIDFEEHLFIKAFEAAKEEYRRQKEGQ